MKKILLILTISLIWVNVAHAQEPLINDAFTPPDVSATESASNYMIGRVAVGIILPESDGSIDPSTEDWTSQERQQVFGEIEDGLDWWVAREPRANLEFITESHCIETSYEPINRPYTHQGLWISQVMEELGYGTPSYFTRVRDYNNALRNQYQTDWAFTIFVVDSSNDEDNEFSDGFFAYAYLGGPFMVMTYGNSDHFPANMDAVTAHETGHIFRALDQYYAAQHHCTMRSGVLYVENQNSDFGDCNMHMPSIMKRVQNSYSVGLVDHYARGQVGWWDQDCDNILDPVDDSIALGDCPIYQTFLPTIGK